ncbi:helix-turn-helix domain-containing protein [Halobium palmae]|uniref:Helix-turn-helix domain-containing protein n=1 Tax=Halobium palmae TaxID=1776492 RepID=A0ABD5RUL3_9EURY
MSQSTLAIPNARPWTSSSDPSVIDTEEEVQDLLDVIDDADCRAILEATSDDALSANELSKICNIPLSTMYRKLDLLTAAGLLIEGTRIRRSGKHTSEYSRRIEKIEVSVETDGGFELKVTQRDASEQNFDAPILGGW